MDTLHAAIYSELEIELLVKLIPHEYLYFSKLSFDQEFGMLKIPLLLPSPHDEQMVKKSLRRVEIEYPITSGEVQIFHVTSYVVSNPYGYEFAEIETVQLINKPDLSLVITTNISPSLTIHMSQFHVEYSRTDHIVGKQRRRYTWFGGTEYPPELYEE